MIVFHYLERSCSHRIVWLLEELGLDYELKMYQRLPDTQLAPPELKAQHPLGKAPVMQDGELVLAEGNALIQHLLDRYGRGRLVPESQTDAYSKYLYWLSVSASMFSANLLALMAKKGDFGAYTDYINAQVGIYFDHVEDTLNGQKWIVSDELTGADFALSFPLQWGINFVEKANYPNIARYLEQIENHPSYLKANAKTAGRLDLSRF